MRHWLKGLDKEFERFGFDSYDLSMRTDMTLVDIDEDESPDSCAEITDVDLEEG